MTRENMDSCLNNIIGTSKIKDLHDRDLVIEAAIENLDIKKKIFAELDSICPEHAILASNTGTLSVVDIARATNRMEKVLGMHFFNPPRL